MCHMVTSCIVCIHIPSCQSILCQSGWKGRKWEVGWTWLLEWCSTQASHEIMKHFAWACFVPLPHQTRSSGSRVGASPQECAQAANDSDLDPALSTRTLTLHFWDWDQALGEGRVLCSEWGWTRACCVTWGGWWGEWRCPLLLCAWGLRRRGV